MKKPPAVSQTVIAWLRNNLGNQCLGPLTGTDARALRAATQIVELYSYHRTAEVLEAFRLVVLCMQESTRELAYHAIAHVMDWSHRQEIWSDAGLERIQKPLVCKYEKS